MGLPPMAGRVDPLPTRTVMSDSFNLLPMNVMARALPTATATALEPTMQGATA